MSIRSVLLLVAAALLVCSGLNPEHFPPWTSFHTEAPAFVASAVLLAAVWLEKRRLALPLPLLLFALLAISAWIQFASGWVTYAGDAWVVTAYLCVLAASWIWGHSTVKSGRPELPLLFVCAVFVAVGLLASFQVLVQWLQVDRYPTWVHYNGVRRPSGNFGQPNQTATLLLMASAAVAVLMFLGRMRRVLGWPLLLLFGWCVVLTQSRTAFVSAIAFVVIVLALGLRNVRVRAWRFDVICWILFVCSSAWVFQTVEWDGAVSGVGALQMTQVGTRPLIWRQLVNGLLEHPLAGYGWLQVASAQQVGALVLPGEEQTNYAHNAILDLFLAVGIPAGLLVLAVTLGWFLRRFSRQASTHPAAMAGLLLLVPFAVHSQLELPHAYAYLLVPAGVLLGSFDAQTQAGVPQFSLPRWSLAAAALAWVVLLGALGWEYAQAEEDYRVNRFENRRLGTTASGYEPPRLVLLTQLGETARAMRLRAEPGMNAEDLRVLKRVSNRYTWAPLHYRTALALGLNGHADEAGQQLKVIKSLFPAEIYADGRTDWIRLRDEKYPELRAVELP